ncbi:MAG: DinB family protein [Anaerolineaceae bacterium]
MEYKDVLLNQFQFAHQTLEQVLEGCDDILHERQPGSTLNSIAACYGHVVLSEDAILNGIVLGETPVFIAGNWSARTGLPATGDASLGGEWPAASLGMNLPAFREYAAAVYARTAEAIGAMTDDKAQELIATPFGAKQPRLEFLGTLGIAHAWGHLGEIAAMKGMHGLKGLPF